MHAAAALSQAGGVLKYALPVSDTSCSVTHRIFVCFTLLFDVSFWINPPQTYYSSQISDCDNCNKIGFGTTLAAGLFTFLLAKVYVTNGDRTLLCWERGIIWLTRVYAWFFLVAARPYSTIFLALTFPGVANSEGTFCYNRVMEADLNLDSSANSNGFLWHNALLVVQLVLLLGVFLKPILVPAEGTQSGGAIYRRVVVRNVVCTACIVTAYVIMTAVAFVALLYESADNNKAAQARDMAIAVNQLVTLCLTEISLPLGFASCWKAIDTVRKQERHAMRPVNGAADAVMKTKVVPIEELPPQTPQTPQSPHNHFSGHQF